MLKLAIFIGGSKEDQFERAAQMAYDETTAGQVRELLSSGPDSESATPMRVKRPAKPWKSFENHRALPSLETLQTVIAVVAPSSRSFSASEGSRPVRQRKILGRYVFGDDLKPGERWKRRLPKGALR
jgi:hypothetical protein